MSNRIPPQNIEAEQAILGTVLLKGESIYEVADTLLPEHFYRDGHKLIWQTMLDITRAGTPVDLITVSASLKTTGKLDMVGGPSYLATLTDLVPSISSMPTYAAMVRDNASLRRMIAFSTDLAATCHESADPAAALDMADATLLQFLTASSATTATSMRELAKKVFREIEAQATSGAPMAGLATGYDYLDAMTSGLCPSDLIILAARPSMGKTALAMNVVRHVSVDNNTPAAVFSMEMSKEQLAMRLFADLGRLDTRRLRQGNLKDADWPKLTNAYGRLAEANIFIDDTPGLTAMALRTKARRLKAQHNIGLVVVDYLQLMEGAGRRNSVREQEISDISRSLKGLAKELNIPVLALSQLNRNLESRPNKRPLLSDLRESGAIEQDADMILFIYRDEVYNKAEDNPRKGIAEIIIGKQRNGPTGTIELAWQERYSSFLNMVQR